MGLAEKDILLHRLTPFDYDTLNDENIFLTRLEDFVIHCVWCSRYSSALFGVDSRPPMAAVAMNVIDMVNYLKTQTSHCSVACYLRDFVEEYPLRLGSNILIDQDAAVHGYLADIFRIVIGLEFDFDQALGWDNRETIRLKAFRNYQDFRFLTASWADRKQFPNRLFPHDQLVETRDPPLPMHDSLELIDAETIHAGPFRIAFTNKLREHLTLSDKTIRIFWEGDNRKHKRSHFPGESFSIYTSHTLGRLPFVCL